MQTYLLLSENKESVETKINQFRKNLEVSSFDFIDFTPVEKIGIDDVREIIVTSIKQPFQGNNKLTVIRNFSNSTFEAQNSILKFLEEQPLFLTIVLVSENTSNILPTVLSRAQIIRELKKASQNKIDLAEILAKNVSEKLVYIQKNITEKEMAVDFLGSLILTLEEMLTADDLLKKTGLTITQVGDMLKKTDRALSYINGNLNYKHVLDILLLGFPHLSPLG